MNNNKDTSLSFHRSIPLGTLVVEKDVDNGNLDMEVVEISEVSDCAAVSFVGKADIIDSMSRDTISNLGIRYMSLSDFDNNWHKKKI